jgi:hypothetical protein
MSKESARKLIADAWIAAVDAANLTYPIEYQNLPFEQPEKGPWGRYTLGMGTTEPAALGTQGAKMDRTPFFVTVQVFIPINEGTLPAYATEAAMALMNYRKLRSPDGKTVVHLRTASLSQGTEQDGLTGFNVTIQGHFDTHQGTA